MTQENTTWLPKSPNLYIAKIRNKAKRNYAIKYLDWLNDNEIGDPPSWAGLSHMAAQAVRLNLR